METEENALSSEPKLTYEEQRALRQHAKDDEAKQKKLKHTSRRSIFLAVVVIIGVGLVAGIAQLIRLSRQSGGQIPGTITVTQTDWIKGDRNAKAILVEYSDFQCPACGYYFPVLKKLAEDFGNQIAIAYRHFPLPNHQNSKPSARAAEAAGKQGKFWEMHDLIFENQSSWKDSRDASSVFIGYAETLGLDSDTFKNDFESKDIRNKVDDAYQSAVGLGLNSTPTFFLNGKKIINPRTYDEFKSVLTEAVSKQ